MTTNLRQVENQKDNKQNSWTNEQDVLKGASK